MRVINFAQGDFLMLSMYVAFYLTTGYGILAFLGPYAGPIIAAIRPTDSCSNTQSPSAGAAVAGRRESPQVMDSMAPETALLSTAGTRSRQPTLPRIPNMTRTTRRSEHHTAPLRSN